MASPFRRILNCLLQSTRSDLRQQVQYLKAENEVLRSRLPRTLRLTREERSRLIKLAKPLGSAIKALVSIVQPDTILRWIRDADRRGPKPRATRTPGRPRTPEEIRGLVLRMAKENSWGYTRILGELKKLGVTVSRGTVANIMKQHGLPIGPSRSERTWGEFIRQHGKTLWACDFLRQRVLTPRGFRDAYLLVFVNMVTRRAIATPSTPQPDRAWVAARIEEFADATANGATRCRVLVRDRDSKFGSEFDAALRERRITPVRLPIRSPNLNAHAERLIQTIRVECLDGFVALGTRHLDHLVREFIEHYNEERPHSGIGFGTPSGRQAPLRITGPPGRVRCRTGLGGVLRHYYRAAG